jgi:hypothetical protein
MREAQSLSPSYTFGVALVNRSRYFGSEVIPGVIFEDLANEASDDQGFAQAGSGIEEEPGAAIVHDAADRQDSTPLRQRREGVPARPELREPLGVRLEDFDITLVGIDLAEVPRADLVEPNGRSCPWMA